MWKQPEQGKLSKWWDSINDYYEIHCLEIWMSVLAFLCILSIVFTIFFAVRLARVQLAHKELISSLSEKTTGTLVDIMELKRDVVRRDLLDRALEEIGAKVAMMDNGMVLFGGTLSDIQKGADNVIKDANAMRKIGEDFEEVIKLLGIWRVSVDQKLENLHSRLMKFEQGSIENETPTSDIPGSSE